MPVAIPVNFDFKTIALDPNEKFLRDELNLSVEHWVKFRHAVNIGINANNLQSKHTAPVSENVKSAYRELGKSHYEVVTSLSCAALSLDMARMARNTDNLLMFQKSCKDFYFHAGCLLDNFARLIYILNDPNSATETKKIKKEFIPQRHWIGWGDLKIYSGHARAKRSKQLNGIKNIRNCLTHSWRIPFNKNQQGDFCWPLAVRLEEKKLERFLWPHDEKGFKKKYRKWLPIGSMMESDMVFLEAFQDVTFKRLIADLRLFERYNNVRIL